MAFWGIGRKKEEQRAYVVNCANTEATDSANSREKKKLNIKVLGSGCKNCHTLLENTRRAVKNLGLDADVEYVTDMEKVTAYGVMSMPALAVNDIVVSAGRVLKAGDVEKLLCQSSF